MAHRSAVTPWGGAGERLLSKAVYIRISYRPHTAVERIKSVATFLCESVARHTMRLDPVCPSLSNDSFCRLVLIVFLGLYPLLAEVGKTSAGVIESRHTE